MITHFACNPADDAAAWRVIPMEETHGLQVCSWRYPTPFEIYHWPSWDELVQRGEEFADAELRESQYTAVIDNSGTLVGFGQLFPLTDEDGAPIIRLGLGLRPDLCGSGRGRGRQLVSLLIVEAHRRSPGCTVDLEVLSWNERAIRTYNKAGFRIADTYVRDTPTGPSEFYCMVYQSMPSQ